MPKNLDQFTAAENNQLATKSEAHGTLTVAQAVAEAAYLLGIAEAEAARANDYADAYDFYGGDTRSAG
jgi:hypothetical protein